ncbi:MAG: hypothetical protein BA873_07930 [Desulfobulbaceae bacterium C00003063]|nr:MAG: hypothetical protein BA873_07930 [Desulfobulbaceae bacterium C00003063]
MWGREEMESRREFLRKIIVAGGMLAFQPQALADVHAHRKHTKDPSCTLYRALNGSPAMNLAKVIEMMGGIENVMGPDDVVVIKPNVQWWNQGAPNLAALKAFVGLVMERPGGFKGEVVLAENCHRGASPWQHAGWTHVFERNSDLPKIHHMGDLAYRMKKEYGSRFSTCHWIDVDSGANRVLGPSEGNGYVYCDGSGGAPLISYDNGVRGDNYRATIMTYPVFTTDNGTVIDLKNGIWKRGSYTGQPLRFINFAALNHHSTYCGATSAIKNYLGVTDLSGGPDPSHGGCLTKNYYNFHSFPFNKWAIGPQPGMLGTEIGVFMKTIRRADLNITTAEWIGLSSRTDPPVAHTRAVLACTDPVALDYHATRYILFPNSRLAIHNPDDLNRPLNHYLVKCAEAGGGMFDEKHVTVESYDFKRRVLQEDRELVIKGNRTWGTSPKAIMKYLVLRYGWL